uniref:Uncharacterized protein n=1 Tax=Norrisiella sphaerica TaxID=552664 RepID=A0A7S2QSK9_9EUKA|mmetsp:Transcript_173/g.242  ORF Transcript_173/g.242 Transcript_173/m.242 type:complete len:109 (+) Transcript_173:131-457(+)
MCHRTNCRQCGKYTWAGCGYHIESALAGTSIEQRCMGWQVGHCPEKKEKLERNCKYCNEPVEAGSRLEMRQKLQSHYKAKSSCEETYKSDPKKYDPVLEPQKKGCVLQ